MTEKEREYLYDSLALRYKIAREGARDKESLDLRRVHGYDSVRAEQIAQDRCERDQLRFFELLREAMELND